MTAAVSGVIVTSPTPISSDEDITISKLVSNELDCQGCKGTWSSRHLVPAVPPLFMELELNNSVVNRPIVLDPSFLYALIILSP